MVMPAPVRTVLIAVLYRACVSLCGCVCLLVRLSVGFLHINRGCVLKHAMGTMEDWPFWLLY